MFRLQFRHGLYLLAIAGLVFYLVGSVSGRNNGSPQSSTSLQALPACDSLAGPQPNWPLWLGVQQTAKVKASFTSWGTFGLNIEYLYDCNTFWPKVSFRSAAEPQAEYLYFGGYWIGGIVGNDTIVSTAVDGWQNVMELSPPVGPGKVPAPSVTCIPGPGDFAMRALSGSFWSAHAQPHWLPIRVATRSYAWHDSARGECIIYDAVVTNTGTVARKWPPGFTYTACRQAASC